MSSVLKAVKVTEARLLLQSASTLRRTAQRAAVPVVSQYLPNTGSVQPMAPAVQTPGGYSSGSSQRSTTADTQGELVIEADRRIKEKEAFERRVANAEADARERGLESGRMEGRKQAQAELQGVLQRLKALLEGIESKHRDFLGTIEDELVALVFAGMSRMAGSLSVSRDSVQETVRRAMTEDSGTLHVRVAPADHEILGVSLQRSEVDWTGVRLRVIADPRVALGGCILESDRGTLDARLETQVEQFRKALLAARAASSAQGSSSS